MWLWIDLAVALLPLGVLAGAVLRLIGSARRLRRELAGLTRPAAARESVAAPSAAPERTPAALP